MHTEVSELNRRRFLTLGTAALATVPIIGLTGCPTGWIAIAEKDAPIVVGIAETLVSIVASLTGTAALTPVAIALIQESAAAFSAATKALSNAIAAYKSTVGTGTLNGIVAALNEVELAAPAVIKAITQAPGGLISIITAGIGTAVSLISAIESLLPSSTPTGNAVAVAPAKRVAVSNVKLPDAQTLKSGFNATLSVYGYGQFQVK